MLFADTTLKKLITLKSIAGGSSILPSAYQQVEYIHSDGYAYIDTGVYGENNICVTLDFQLEEIADTMLFGASESASKNAFRFMIRGGQYFATTWGNNANYDIKPDGVSVAADTNRHTIKQDRQYAYLDGRLGYTYTGLSAFKTPMTMYIGRRSGHTDSTKTMAMKIYSCEIKDDGEVIRNFIPCYRKSDDAVGMYDTAEGVFYTNANQSKGNFTIPG